MKPLKVKGHYLDMRNPVVKEIEIRVSYIDEESSEGEITEVLSFEFDNKILQVPFEAVKEFVNKHGLKIN